MWGERECVWVRLLESEWERECVEESVSGRESVWERVWERESVGESEFEVVGERE